MFFELIYILLALNMGNCIQQGDLFHSAGLYRNHSQHTQKLGQVLEKMQVNGLEG